MRIEIARTEPAFEGKSFGSAGAYEKIVGTIHGAADPAHPLNAGIVNLGKAPRNAAGQIEYEVDFYLLKPADMARGNRRIFHDVLNRGNKVALHTFNEAPRDSDNPMAMSVNDPCTAEDAGNGFLMRQGYAILWIGWQGAGVMGGDGLMEARLPVATEADGPIVGLSREEFVFEHMQSPVAAPLTYPASATDPAQCTLTVRQREADPRTPIGPEGWRFLSPDRIEITRPAGFDAGAIYEFIYPARDPIVMGLGFAAVRDAVAFLRHEAADRAGHPNPLNLDGAPAIERVHAFGMSQAGRFLRDFVHQGFNEDLSGRKVFDGVFACMAGSRKAFVNYPFAQPGRFSRQHEDRLFPHDQFPFTYAVTTDPVSGRTDGVLKRCLASDTCPGIVQVESSSDFFHGRASLLVTDGEGQEVALPDCVRLYHFASVQHGGGRATANYARSFPFTRYELNPADCPGVYRALLAALDRWTSDGMPPPPSRFPRAGDGTLVPAAPESYGFPAIPGASYPGLVNELSELDHAVQPPEPIFGRNYVVLVPAIDADGNEIAGIRVPDIAVPRATHTGWAPRRAGFAEGELMALGACFPFAATERERLAAGDPRPSLEARYPTRDDYLREVRKAAEALCREGFLLPEDVEQVMEEARAAV